MRCKPLAYALLVSLFVMGCGDDKTAATPSSSTGGGAAKPGETAPTGSLTDLKIEDIKPGKGKAAEKGDVVWVLYTGTLANGNVFDSTDKHENKPFRVEIGAGQVIEGWDKGLVGVKVGGERKLSIPWKMAYGDTGSDSIPARSDLFFDVKTLAMVKKGDEDLVNVESQTPGTGPEVKEGDTITFNYTISLPNDEVADKGTGVTATVGKNIVPPGLDQGVVGMKQGGKRRLVIPPSAGFPFGKGKVPAQSVIIVDVEVTKVQKGSGKA